LKSAGGKVRVRFLSIAFKHII